MKIKFIYSSEKLLILSVANKDELLHIHFYWLDENKDVTTDLIVYADGHIEKDVYLNEDHLFGKDL